MEAPAITKDEYDALLPAAKEEKQKRPIGRPKGSKNKKAVAGENGVESALAKGKADVIIVGGSAHEAAVVLEDAPVPAAEPLGATVFVSDDGKFHMLPAPAYGDHIDEEPESQRHTIAGICFILAGACSAYIGFSMM